jgi:hypothetical protein
MKRLTLAVVALASIGIGIATAAEPRSSGTSAPRSQRTAEAAAAEAAARAWLELVDGRRYDESWDAAAALFRDAVPKETWATQLRALRAPLGATVKRELRSAAERTSLPGAPDGAYVVLQFDTVFEHKQAAVETVTPRREADGTWRVSGYYVR